MTDATEKLDIALDDEGDFVIRVGSRGVARDFDALMAMAPRASALDLALAVTELVHGDDFEVIEDPAAFQAAYEAQLATEDRSQPWAEAVRRLCDYGRPDFTAIKAPELAAGTATWFLRDGLTGLAFRVDLAPAPGVRAPEPQPLALTPLPGPSPEVVPVPQTGAIAEPDTLKSEAAGQ